MTEGPSRRLPTVTGYAAKCAIAALHQHDIATQPLLKRAGLSEHAFDDPHRRVPALAQVKLLEYAADSMADTAFGLHLAEQANPRQAGLIFYVVSAAANLGEGLDLFARYCRIVNDSARMQLSGGLGPQSSSLASWEFRDIAQDRQSSFRSLLFSKAFGK